MTYMAIKVKIVKLLEKIKQKFDIILEMGHRHSYDKVYEKI